MRTVDGQTLRRQLSPDTGDHISFVGLLSAVQRGYPARFGNANVNDTVNDLP
jgi:hypothetical protein